VDLWCVELDRVRYGLAAILAELWDARNAESAPDRRSDPDSVAIVTDGSRWSEPIRLLTADDPRDADKLLVIDTPSPLSGACNPSLSSTIASVIRRNGKDVDQIASSLAQLIGPEFAFALIDMNAASVALVRDPVGTRPLYWRRNRNAVAFSSARDRLLDFGSSPQINESAVAIMLASEKDAWSTQELQAGFHRVPPGGYALLTRETVTTGQWWAPTLSSRHHPPRDRVEVAQEVRGLVEQAITSRLGTSEAVGAHVSGGVDSTGVATIGARHLTKTGRSMIGAYAWSPARGEGFPDMGRHDERRRIEAFAAREGVPVRFGGATAEDLVAFLARPIELEGTADLLDEMPVLRMAQADGVRIMLSGWGGDEVFSSHGVGYLSYLLRTFQWDRAARWIRAQLRTLRRIGPVASLLWKQGIHPMLPDFLYRLLDPYQSSGQSQSLISPNLLGQHRDHVREVQNAFRESTRPIETMFRHFMVGHITHRIETWDVWSRQHGFRYTYPLTDRLLVEKLLSLPPEQHYPREAQRGLALEVLADTLPPDVAKYDAANEASRTASRRGAWRILAEMHEKGHFQTDCPWLDMKRFRERLANPADQTTVAGVLAFRDLFTAMRVWHMWNRQEGRTLLAAAS
jgi:asparagine synthase (glutamine-hydrolysing)